MIPYTELSKQAWRHLMDLQLADPHFNVPSRIDCILNSEVYAAVSMSGIKRGSPGSPVALRTVFGWVLMEAIHSENSSCIKEAHHVTVHHELPKTVERFWETEEILTSPILSTSEQECYDHFHKTHARDQQGRFIVRLPFVKPPIPLNSRGIAETCLSRLERRFSRQTDLFEAYRSFMREYLELSHMEVMSDVEVLSCKSPKFLVTYLLPKLEKKPTKVFCWSDSRIVLAWLRSHPSRWKSFVANRLSEILSSLPSAVWNHVRSADNPADLATRGLTPIQLKDSVIWWSGPSWLQYPSSEWPSEHSNDIRTDEEARSMRIFAATVEEVAEFAQWLSKYISIDKIIRILAYIYRWRIKTQKNLTERRHKWLTVKELNYGSMFLVRLIQREVVSTEIEVLRTTEIVKNNSVLCQLSPFLDVEGVLRVEGRLQNAFLSEEEKHPIILPGKHHVVRLLIRKAHKITLHGGATLVQSHLSRQFWIVRGRNVITGVIRECTKCVRYRVATLEQRMGPLPAVRTRPAKPFSFVGVDFAGPFAIRYGPGRGQRSYKGYVSIFICLVVRAVHIELVSDLTSAAFLAAFRRFTARRGLCQVVYSDNGRNFRGADAELQRLLDKTSAMSQEIAAELAHDRVEWKYIPPRAPNFGGLWEASVKSFKGHLGRVIGESKLTFEEFYTVSASIEACLNSRPLSLLSSSEEDVAALTLGHFLIGASLMAPPEPFVKINKAHTVSSRWQLVTLMRNYFWKRCQKEFLLQLQHRSKWLHPNRTFKVGDVVLFKDELMPPTKWPLARISKIYPGQDGLSRVVCIKTASAEYKRPVNKLILLPSNEEASSHLAQLRTLMEGEDFNSRSSED